MGGLDLEVKHWTADARAALLYLGKYLVKFPKQGFPRWLLVLDRRVRWVQGNKVVGRIVTDQEPTEKSAPTEDAAASLPRRQRCLAVRQVDCGQFVEFFRERDTGQGVKLEFWGRLPRAVFETTGKRVMLLTDKDERLYVEGYWPTFADLAVSVRRSTPLAFWRRADDTGLR